MNAITITGIVDEDHRLTADVPVCIPPGQVTILIETPEEDEAGADWTAGIACEWADELSDSRQDIYTLADGEPVNESR